MLYQRYDSVCYFFGRFNLQWASPTARRYGCECSRDLVEIGIDDAWHDKGNMDPGILRSEVHAEVSC